MILGANEDVIASLAIIVVLIGAAVAGFVYNARGRRQR